MVISLIVRAAIDPSEFTVILAVCSPLIAGVAMVGMKLLLRVALLLLGPSLALLLAPVVAIFTNPFED